MIDESGCFNNATWNRHWCIWNSFNGLIKAVKSEPFGHTTQPRAFTVEGQNRKQGSETMSEMIMLFEN